MDTIAMSKYHGLGNDYLVLDPNKNTLKLTGRQIENICRRNFGVCADEVLYGPVVEDGKFTVKIYNHDGDLEESKNGILIFAKYLKDNGYTTDSAFVIKTFTGEKQIDMTKEDEAGYGSGALGTIHLAENFFS
ncbi:MAG: hypothetical protein K6G40_07730 [Eubacterium sp.]|nr:hypothetical protein [Eubacterium sp.]